MKLLIQIWLKMLFFVTIKVEINAISGYCAFVTDETSQNALYTLRV